MKAFDYLDRWIFDEYRPCVRGLPYFRVLFSVYLLVFYLPAYGWLAEMPQTFYHPLLSVATLFPTLPPGWFFWTLDLVMEFGALCLLFGRSTRIVTFALCAGLIFGNSFRYAIGPKIDHDILVIATLFCMGFSGWGERLSWDERHAPTPAGQKGAAWPLALLMMIIGICMLNASLPKAFSGWANPHVLACRGQLIINYLENVRPTLLTDFLLRINSPLFWKMADYSTLVVEGGFILCIFWLPAMRLIATIAIFFHVFIYFSMDILFIFNLAAYACVLDLRMFLGNSWVRHPLARFGHFAGRVGLGTILMLSLLLVGGFYLLHYFDIRGTRVRDVVTVIVALGIASGSLLYYVGQLADRLVYHRAFPLRGEHALIILYDGECGICDQWVQFVLKYDRHRVFRFAPLQSAPGQELLRKSGDAPTDLSTIVLLIDGQAYLRSTAALMILRQLGGWRAAIGAFGLVPLVVRDFVYGVIAKNRHKWLPKTSCPIPTARQREQFLA